MSDSAVIYREESPRIKRHAPPGGRLALLLPTTIGLILVVATLGAGFAGTKAPVAPGAATGEQRGDFAADLRRALGTTTPLAPPASRANDAGVRPTALPAAPAPPVVSLQQRVAEAETGLRTGQFDATIQYRDGTRVSSVARFDLGDRTRAARAYMVTSYHSGGGSRTSERATVANQTWQRLPDGRWSPQPAQPGVLQQVQVLLPHTDAAATLDMSGNDATFRWYDESRDMDVTLAVDPATGVPRHLRQESRTNGVVVTVAYHDWNGDVESMFPSTMPRL